MAAPKYVPTLPTDAPRTYGSPDHVPDDWRPDRPGDLGGAQPRGPRLGTQGPDQGYALRLATLLEPALRLQPGERCRRRDPRLPRDRVAPGIAVREGAGHP